MQFRWCNSSAEIPATRQRQPVQLCTVLRMHPLARMRFVLSQISKSVCMRSSQVWLRSIQLFRASSCQYQSSNSPGLDPSILRHSGILGTADEAVLSNVHWKKNQKKPPSPFLICRILEPVNAMKVRPVAPKLSKRVSQYSPALVVNTIPTR